MLLECLLAKTFPGPGKHRGHGSAGVWTDHHFSKWRRGHELQNNSQTYPDWLHGPCNTEISISQSVWSTLLFVFLIERTGEQKTRMPWFYRSQPWKTAYSVALPCVWHRGRSVVSPWGLSMPRKWKIWEADGPRSLQIKTQRYFHKLFYW